MAVLKPTPLFDCNNFEHTFYLYSLSSNASVVKVENGEKLNTFLSLFVRGESLFIEDKIKGQEYIQRLISKYQAKIVFCERACNLVCEYYYSPRIFDYLVINGKRVNLHVVTSNNGITIASPLVFDGF